MNESPNHQTSRWVEIIDHHRQTYQLGPWSIIPREHFGLIAQQCGESELAEIRLRLSELVVQSREVPEWDEDAQEEIWRAREMFAMVLKFHGQHDVTED
jgi:hypothetical protein